MRIVPLMNLPTKTKTVTEVDHVVAGESAKTYRLQRDMSLRAVAKKMGISAPYLSDLENGNRRWSMKLWLAFRKAAQ